MVRELFLNYLEYLYRFLVFDFFKVSTSHLQSKFYI